MDIFGVIIFVFFYDGFFLGLMLSFLLPFRLKRVRADPYDDDPIWEHSALNSEVAGAGSGRPHCEGGAPSFPI